LFNNNVENEADFCEAYKSQILNDDSSEKESSLGTVLKIVTILLLLAIIVGISIYGYNYFIKNSTSGSKVSSPPVSIQSLEDDELGDLKVELVPVENKMPMVKKVEIQSDKPETKIDNKPKVVTSKPVEELDIDKIANDVKLAIAKNEQEEARLSSKKSSEQSKVLEVQVEDTQSAYLEELAKLSKEIDKERE